MKIKILSIVLIVCILILILFHLNEFLKINDRYEILQVNNKLENYRKYYLNNLPIIFNNHFDKLESLLSPLTIKNNTIKDYKFKNKFISHHRDKLFIYSDKDVTINLISPKEYNKFKVSSEYHPNLKLLDNIKNNYNFVEVKLKAYKILYIPRKWIFSSEDAIDIYFSESFFSFLFTFYEIIPFIKNKIFCIS